MSDFFKGIFETHTANDISPENFLLCVGVSLAMGLLIAVCSRYRTLYSRNFFISLTVMPAIVCLLIMMVNGNIGAGVAIASAFALVRFRSSEGDARQITLVFLSMASGLIVGMGYLAYAALFTIILCVAIMILSVIWPGRNRSKMLIKISLPEEIDYNGLFDDVLRNYTRRYELVSVRTSDSGSIFKLTYKAEISDASKEKIMIDEIRKLNGGNEVAIVEREEQKPML